MIKIERVFPDSAGLALVAGPCSAESRDQVLETAFAVKKAGAQVLRAGLWKPRTHPGSFEGVGAMGLEWLVDAGRRAGLGTATEVMSGDHVRACIDAGIDIIWLGARTVSSPYLVQEIADAIGGSGVPVLVKNPLGADAELWIGALERLSAAGVRKLAAVHRGFPGKAPGVYRNDPAWEMSAELRLRVPGIQILCDPSHIAGDSRLVPGIAKRALDLGFDGLMVEVHPSPESALSDSAQQLSPEAFSEMVASLMPRRNELMDNVFNAELSRLRSEIDSVDAEIVSAVSRRMHLSGEIGRLKKRSNVSIIQSGRWEKVLNDVVYLGAKSGLDESFVRDLYNLIHRESVKRQE